MSNWFFIFMGIIFLYNVYEFNQNEYEIKLNDKLIICESKVTYDDRVLLKKCTSKQTPDYEFELKLEIVDVKEI